MPTTMHLLESFRPVDPALKADLAISDKPWLRDIAWLLHAPDMATIGYAGRPTLAALGLDAADTRRHWLASLEAQEALFQEQRKARRSQRLGIYHETLWQWILQHAPKTQLLAHNIVLREGNRTFGELDLLYRTSEPNDRSMTNRTGRFEHAELAIKFFLGLPEGPGHDDSPSRWIGIGSFDSLAIKCHRLLHRQLPVALSDLASDSRQRWMPQARLHQRTIMPGFLYHPWTQRLHLPKYANPRALQGLWCPYQDWPALADALPRDTRGHFLIKPHWLAPPPDPGMSLDTLGNALTLHFSRHRMPCHLQLSLPDGRGCRLFVVMNDWPPMVPLPPRTHGPSAH